MEQADEDMLWFRKAWRQVIHSEQQTLAVGHSSSRTRLGHLPARQDGGRNQSRDFGTLREVSGNCSQVPWPTRLTRRNGRAAWLRCGVKAINRPSNGWQGCSARAGCAAGAVVCDCRESRTLRGGRSASRFSWMAASGTVARVMLGFQKLGWGFGGQNWSATVREISK